MPLSITILVQDNGSVSITEVKSVGPEPRATQSTETPRVLSTLLSGAPMTRAEFEQSTVLLAQLASKKQIDEHYLMNLLDAYKKRLKAKNPSAK